MAINKKGAIFILAAILISAFFNFRSPNIPDPDSLYHLRHAYLLRTNGIFDTGFPWTYYTSVRTHAADLWYGFHLLLIPFTFGKNLLLNLKITATLFTGLLLLSFYWVGQRLRFSFPAFWPFLFLFAIPNALFQLLMVRPHVISLALSVFLLPFLIQGSFWMPFLISTGITFFHLSFFWLAPGIAVLNSLIRIFQKNDFKKGLWQVLAVMAGTIIGVVLRPEPIAALKLVYIQVVRLLVEKQGDLSLLFSRELAPLSFGSLTKVSPIFLLLWLIITAIFIRQTTQKSDFKKISLEQKLFLWLSGILSLGFLFMTLFVARRSLMFWPAFGTLFLAGTYSFFAYKKFIQELFYSLLVIGFLIMIPVTLYKNTVSLAQNAMPPEYLREAAEWLRNNSASGEVVFNTHWDNFPALFFWNQTSYYIGGMDPIFQYDYDSVLYWKFHHISQDEYGDLTCGVSDCPKDDLKDVYSVLKNDFRAKYVLVEKRRNPNFQRTMESDPRFEKKFDTGKEAVFLVN